VIPVELHQWTVLIVIILLIVGLFKETIRPVSLFFGATVFFIVAGILKVKDFVSGFANEQIITIFLLIFITSALRKNFNLEALFNTLFKKVKTARAFLFQLMFSVAAISSLINNTPLVAFLTPYVHSWGLKNGIPPSKLLIPLSFATILGGMITVIGTSTNLVLDGFIKQSNAVPLQFEDFFYLGLIVSVVGILFLATVGQRLLPAHKDAIKNLEEQSREYLVETLVESNSKLIGKTVAQAKLRNLNGIFLAEIIRGTRRISPAAPEEIIEANDILIFAGNTATIIELVNSDNGLTLPKFSNDYWKDKNKIAVYEAVIPANSFLSGKTVKSTNFRQRFDAAIIAIHRNGEKIKEKIGNIQLIPGDLLLLTAGKGFFNNAESTRDLYLVSKLEKPKLQKSWKNYLIAVVFLVNIVLIVSGQIPLFKGLLFIFTGLLFLGYFTLEDVKKELDLSLVGILVCALAVGHTLVSSGAADTIAQSVISLSGSTGQTGVMCALFLTTVALTSFITNVAAVSIVFPIATSLSRDLAIDTPALYVAIAYGASAAFLTPVGYQTNLMIYGPGGYEFKDFFRIGVPFTLIYSLICIVFISLYYGLL
jgi:di/tricarboxylate transporter